MSFSGVKPQAVSLSRLWPTPTPPNRRVDGIMHSATCRARCACGLIDLFAPTLAAWGVIWRLGTASAFLIPEQNPVTDEVSCGEKQLKRSAR